MPADVTPTAMTAHPAPIIAAPIIAAPIVAAPVIAGPIIAISAEGEHAFGVSGSARGIKSAKSS
jgi:hypothetical protein